MSKREKDLERLKKVTEAVWLGASQTLRRKAGEERAAAARVSRLADDRSACLQHLSADEAPGIGQITTTARWLRWSAAERARLNVGLARLRAELAEEQEAAKTAFARDCALETLLGKMKAARRSRS